METIEKKDTDTIVRITEIRQEIKRPEIQKKIARAEQELQDLRDMLTLLDKE